MRRTPEGQPEFRSLDDMLKHALEQEDLSQLPGYGKPIDLTGYNTSNPETRVTDKLLNDNEVLPQPLQERREAEKLRQDADEYLDRQLVVLVESTRRIEPVADALIAPFPDRRTVLELLGLGDWPSYLPEPRGAELPRRQTFRRSGAVLLELVSRHNRHIEAIVSQYLQRLRRFNDCVGRLNTQVSLSPQLPQLPNLRAADPASEEAAARDRLTPMVKPPADIERRLDAYHREADPPLWQRLIRALRRS